MFFWIATICNLLYYLGTGVASVFVGLVFSTHNDLAEIVDFGALLTVSGALELVFATVCIVLMVLGFRKTRYTISLLARYLGDHRHI